MLGDLYLKDFRNPPLIFCLDIYTCDEQRLGLFWVWNDAISAQLERHVLICLYQSKYKMSELRQVEQRRRDDDGSRFLLFIPRKLSNCRKLVIWICHTCLVHNQAMETIGDFQNYETHRFSHRYQLQWTRGHKWKWLLLQRFPLGDCLSY